MRHSLFDATFHADSEYDIHFAREYSTDTQNIEKKQKNEKNYGKIVPDLSM